LLVGDKSLDDLVFFFLSSDNYLKKKQTNTLKICVLVIIDYSVSFFSSVQSFYIYWRISRIWCMLVFLKKIFIDDCCACVIIEWLLGLFCYKKKKTKKNSIHVLLFFSLCVFVYFVHKFYFVWFFSALFIHLSFFFGFVIIIIYFFFLVGSILVFVVVFVVIYLTYSSFFWYSIIFFVYLFFIVSSLSSLIRPWIR